MRLIEWWGRAKRVIALRRGAAAAGDLDRIVVRRAVLAVGMGPGLVLLLFAGPSDSEKKGYHF